LRRLVIALRIVIGAVFVAAGAGKLVGGPAPRLAPVVLGGAPGPVATAASVVEDALPLLELLAGLAVWGSVGRWVRSLLGIGLAVIATGVAVMIPEGVRCGCFGFLGGPEGRVAHLSVASGLLAATIALAAAERARNRRSRNRLMSHDLQTIEGNRALRPQ